MAIIDYYRSVFLGRLQWEKIMLREGRDIVMLGGSDKLICNNSRDEVIKVLFASCCIELY